MRRLVLCLACLVAWSAPAHADTRVPMQRLVLDRVDVEPSPLPGLARLRLFVSAVDLGRDGDVLPIWGQKTWQLKVGSSARRIPYLAGFYDTADTHTAIVIVVETAFEYTDELKAIKDALDSELLAKLPPDTEVAVIGYGDTITGRPKPGPVKQAQAALQNLSAESSPGSPAMLLAIDKAMRALKRVKTTPEHAPVRKLIILVSDGRDRDDDRDKVTRYGAKAGKEDVRIEPLAFTTGSKGPLLNLGELAKQSLGTFRWVRTDKGFKQAAQHLADEINHQYVLTFLIPADDVTGKKISVSTKLVDKEIESNQARAPLHATCGGDECPARTPTARPTAASSTPRPAATASSAG